MSYSAILEAVRDAIVSATNCEIAYDSIAVEASIPAFVSEFANEWISANITLGTCRPKLVESGGFVTASVNLNIDIVKDPSAQEYDYISAIDSILNNVQIIEAALTDNTLGGLCLNSRSVSMAESTLYAPSKASRLVVEFERQWQS